MPTGTAAQEPPPEPDPAFSTPLVRTGEIVVTLFEAGEVLAVDAAGERRVLATGLDRPRGIAVLADGSLVVAEFGANRLVGLGGRYPAEPVTVLEYPTPADLLVLAPGRLLVTSLLEGTLSEVDLASDTVTEVGAGLDGPLGITVAGGGRVVTEFFSGALAGIGPGGEVDRLAEDLGQPTAVVSAPGGGFYVTDVEAGTVLFVDGGERSVVAEVPGPEDVMVLLGPTEDNGALLLVVTAEGLVTVAADTGETDVVVTEPGVVGMSLVGDIAAPLADLEPPPDPEALASDPQAGGDGAATTDDGDRPEVEVSSFLPVILVAVVILVGVSGAFWWQVRRARRLEEELDLGGGERTVESFAETFGPCVAEELALERAEAALGAIEAQLDRARARAEAAVEEVARCREALGVLVEQREVARAAAEDAAMRGDDAVGPHPIWAAEPLLTTEDGRAALEEYRTGALSPLAMAQRWEAAGETEAIARVRQEGDRAKQVDLSVPSPEERRLAAELARADVDVLEARDDVLRFTTRHEECRANVWSAQAALATCRKDPPPQPVKEGEDPEQSAAWAVDGDSSPSAGS
ncbi:MAG: hypothetical protein JJU45_00605 [Acidimicrobiia bacterium]|nr:hypothetical protein [Acidimicrobiia bacterium]